MPSSLRNSKTPSRPLSTVIRGPLDPLFPRCKWLTPSFGWSWLQTKLPPDLVAKGVRFAHGFPSPEVPGSSFRGDVSSGGTGRIPQGVAPEQLLEKPRTRHGHRLLRPGPNDRSGGGRQAVAGVAFGWAGTDPDRGVGPAPHLVGVQGSRLSHHLAFDSRYRLWRLSGAVRVLASAVTGALGSSGLRRLPLCRFPAPGR